MYDNTACCVGCYVYLLRTSNWIFFPLFITTTTTTIVWLFVGHRFFFSVSFSDLCFFCLHLNKICFSYLNCALKCNVLMIYGNIFQVFRYQYFSLNWIIFGRAAQRLRSIQKWLFYYMWNFVRGQFTFRTCHHSTVMRMFGKAGKDNKMWLFCKNIFYIFSS